MANRYVAMATQAAERYGVNVSIFLAMINQESGFNPNARSSAGAIGIAQFMPGTARSLGVNPYDPRSSLFGAARFLAQLVRKYGSYQRALSAYNSGRPDAYLDPGFAGGQTYNYVRTIMSHAKGPVPTPKDVVGKAGAAFSGVASAVGKASAGSSPAGILATVHGKLSGSQQLVDTGSPVQPLPETTIPGLQPINSNFVAHRDLAPVWDQIARQPGVSQETVRYAQRAQETAGVA